MVAADPARRVGRHRRFDQIQADLGISRKVLTERLNRLVEQGVLERRPYDARPRYEYVLTAKGADLVDMLMVMVRWGDRWLAGQAGPRSSTATTPAAVSGCSQRNGGEPAREPIRTMTRRARSRSTTRRPVRPVPPMTATVGSERCAVS